MVWVNSNSSDDEIFDTVLAWIDILSQADYERVANELGYWDFDNNSATKAIRETITEYRSVDLFPDGENFRVSDWRQATGGNSAPIKKLVWHDKNLVGIVASVSFDLPLNGAWSDLTADFLLFERDNRPGQYQLRLEEITQRQRP
jgi:hypothetical protein